MPRESIDIESFVHQNPIPAATRIGPFLTSSITVPYNPGTREIPDDLESQIANIFLHVGNMLDAAGASWDDMAKMTFYVADPGESRAALNGPWVERFPDPASRPSRHNMKADLGGRMKISCTFEAYIE